VIPVGTLVYPPGSPHLIGMVVGHEYSSNHRGYRKLMNVVKLARGGEYTMDDTVMVIE
jgi:hypothetical protein